MQSRQYALVAAVIFAIVAIGHAARIFYGWPVVIGSIDIPMAVSWMAVVVAGLLAVAGFGTSRSA
jgi:hypothetical protein